MALSGRLTTQQRSSSSTRKWEEVPALHQRGQAARGKQDAVLPTCGNGLLTLPPARCATPLHAPHLHEAVSAELDARGSLSSLWTGGDCLTGRLAPADVQPCIKSEQG